MTHKSPEQEMNEQEQRIKERLARIRNILIVMSGKGGVGKSTIAVNLAVGLVQSGFKTGLMDVDLHGPSTLKMLGLEDKPINATADFLIPLSFNQELKVISMASLLENSDAAVIWRGPLKIVAIKQFIADVLWDDLDYLIIDSPPGTGDEPLTVAQLIPRAKSIIVTTPQQVSILDIRKSIIFCRKINMEVLGIIENMSGLTCPHCGEDIDLFSYGGGEKTAEDMDVPFLGRIPIDPKIVTACDQGKPFILDPAGAESFNPFVERIVRET
ncbi:MAG: P-loop NTPase [Spirochaeta sp.]|nr:P-loop NTPase [Spirochaeta sp.]